MLSVLVSGAPPGLQRPNRIGRWFMRMGAGIMKRRETTVATPNVHLAARS